MLSKQDAATALEEVGAAERRAVELAGYRRAAPHLILWGLIWLVANVLTDQLPQGGQWAWPVLALLGTLASLGLGLRSGRSRPGADAMTRAGDRRMTLRMVVTMAVAVGFLVATGIVVWPLDSRQMNGFISLYWAFLYMGVGIWIGTRLFLIGLVTAGLILLGYFGLTQHFSLWMGVVGGGALVAGGLWLRKL